MANYTNHQSRTATEVQKDGLSYACLDMNKLESEKYKPLSPFFLRKPYFGTSAETKDFTQEILHENDYLK